MGRSMPVAVAVLAAVLGIRPGAAVAQVTGDVSGTAKVTIVLETEDGAPEPYAGLTFFAGPGLVFSAHNVSQPFTASLPPADYRIRVSSLTRGYAVASLTADDVDLLTSPLRVTAGRSMAIRLRVTTTLRFVAVRGRVTPRDASEKLPGFIGLYRDCTPRGINESVGVTDRPPGFIEPPRDTGQSFRAPLRPDGSFEFPKVAPGEYRAAVQSSNHYRDVCVRVPDTGLDDVQIALPARVPLAGRMHLEGDGPPIYPGLLLKIDPEETGGLGHGLLVGRANSFRMTVEEGNYSIELLELPPGYVMTSVKIGDRDVTKVPFRVTDGTPEVVITVTAPVTKPWRRVEGVIVNPLNAGGTSAETVQLQDSGMNLWLEAMVGPDGRFAFPKVLPGTYITRLVSSATRPDILGLPIINENPTLVVTDSDIRDLRLERVTTPLLAAVTARVTVDDDGPRPSVQFQIDGKPLSSSQADLLDGRLLLRLPYGEHRIGATVSLDGIIVKSLRYGDIDLLKNTARIVPGQREELVVVLTAPIPRVLHRVQGRIVRQGPPATQERVTLDGDHQRVSVLANPDGSFDFPRVTAGVYRWSTQEIVVPDRDVTDLILRVGARVPVVVDVTGDDGRGQQDLPHCPFEIRSSSGTGNCALGSGSALQVRDGDRVTVNNLPAWYKLESLRYGSIDLLRDPFLFDGTSTAIRIGITPSGPPPGRPAYTLRGRVVGRKEGQINLLVRLRAAVGGGSLDQRVADDGSFAFTNVLPSTYELQVVGSTSRARVVVSGADVGDIVLLAAP